MATLRKRAETRATELLARYTVAPKSHSRYALLADLIEKALSMGITIVEEDDKASLYSISEHRTPLAKIAEVEEGANPLISLGTRAGDDLVFDLAHELGHAQQELPSVGYDPKNPVCRSEAHAREPDAWCRGWALIVEKLGRDAAEQFRTSYFARAAKMLESYDYRIPLRCE